MTLLPFFKQSQTTMQISQYLLPLALVTGVACLLAIGSYFFILVPSQSRLTETTLAYERGQHTLKQNRIAWNTQLTLRKVWEQLPLRKGLTGLGVAISDLAKSHKVRIPEIGYNIKKFRHKLATQGTMSFKAAGRYEAILSAERAKKGNEVAFSIDVSTFLRDKKDGGSPRQGSSL
jgi:hypothetical protein